MRWESGWDCLEKNIDTNKSQCKISSSYKSDLLKIFFFNHDVTMTIHVYILPVSQYRIKVQRQSISLPYFQSFDQRINEN